MPKTLWDRVIFCLIFAALLFPGVLKAGSMPLDECTQYGAFAFDLYRMMEKKQTSDGLMEDVLLLLGERHLSIPKERLEAIVAAAKVHPRQAYEFLEEVADKCKKKEGYFKVASSEGLMKGLKIANCQTALQDEKIIHDYVENGWTHEELLALAGRAPDLDENRRARVIELINEAFAHEGGVDAWFNAKWQACLKD